MSVISYADNTSQTFIKLYYETIDKKRNILNKLYHENAVIVWDGNRFQGLDEIKNFFNGLPTFDHGIDYFDAQPINSQVTNGQTSVSLSVHGVIKIDDCPTTSKEYRKPKLLGFNQIFILIVENDKWKIISDWVRTHECD